MTCKQTSQYNVSSLLTLLCMATEICFCIAEKHGEDCSRDNIELFVELICNSIGRLRSTAPVAVKILTN